MHERQNVKMISSESWKLYFLDDFSFKRLYDCCAVRVLLKIHVSDDVHMSFFFFQQGHGALWIDSGDDEFISLIGFSDANVSTHPWAFCALLSIKKAWVWARTCLQSGTLLLVCSVLRCSFLSAQDFASSSAAWWGICVGGAAGDAGPRRQGGSHWGPPWGPPYSTSRGGPFSYHISHNLQRHSSRPTRYLLIMK